MAGSLAGSGERGRVRTAGQSSGGCGPGAARGAPARVWAASGRPFGGSDGGGGVRTAPSARVDDGRVDHAAVRDEASVDLGGRADAGRRALLGPGVDDPVLVVQVEVDPIVEQGEIRLPVRLDRPDVLPVAVEVIAVDPGAGVE